jgi:hypothetical protein
MAKAPGRPAPPPDAFGALVPIRFAGGNLERKIAIQILEGLETGIVGQLAIGKDAEGPGEGR